MTTSFSIDLALERPGVRRALKLAAGHMNVSAATRISEAHLLACLQGRPEDGPSGNWVAAFLTESDLATICDLVVCGAVTYGQLATAAAVHLPALHPTRKWLDDRAAH